MRQRPRQRNAEAETETETEAESETETEMPETTQTNTDKETGYKDYFETRASGTRSRDRDTHQNKWSRLFQHARQAPEIIPKHARQVPNTETFTQTHAIIDGDA